MHMFVVIEVEQRRIIYDYCQEKGPNATARKSLKLIGKRLQRGQVTTYVKQYEQYLGDQIKAEKIKDEKANTKRKGKDLQYLTVSTQFNLHEWQ